MIKKRKRKGKREREREREREEEEEEEEDKEKETEKERERTSLLWKKCFNCSYSGFWYLLVRTLLEHYGAYQNPIETLHKPFVFPSVCLGLAWVFDGS